MKVYFSFLRYIAEDSCENFEIGGENVFTTREEAVQDLIDFVPQYLSDTFGNMLLPYFSKELKEEITSYEVYLQRFPINNEYELRTFLQYHVNTNLDDVGVYLDIYEAEFNHTCNQG